ncbi:hypothetical protein HZS_2143 [Henneguya salminicola]|nr:hypothetical protein HZS_2143 [Henneguya salminicola]
MKRVFTPILRCLSFLGFFMIAETACRHAIYLKKPGSEILDYYSIITYLLYIFDERKFTSSQDAFELGVKEREQNFSPSNQNITWVEGWDRAVVFNDLNQKSPNKCSFFRFVMGLDIFCNPLYNSSST